MCCASSVLLVMIMRQNCCHDDSFFQTMDRLKRVLDANGIEHSEKRFNTEKGVESLGESPFVCYT